jgi:hypothetical protein
VVDAADYVVWRDRISDAAAAASVSMAAVPEPDTLALAVMCGFWLHIGTTASRKSLFRGCNLLCNNPPHVATSD